MLECLPQFKVSFLYMPRLIDRLRWKNKHIKYIVVSNIWNNKCRIPEAVFQWELLWISMMLITSNKHFCKWHLLIWQIEGHHSKSVMFIHVINCIRWLVKDICYTPLCSIYRYLSHAYNRNQNIPDENFQKWLLLFKSLFGGWPTGF